MMSILEEAAQLVRKKLDREFEQISIERIIIGLFFAAVKLSNGAGGMRCTPIADAGG